MVMVGPVVKIDPAEPAAPAEHALPRRQDLRRAPAYLAGWDVALMPFAVNEVDPLHQPDQDAGIPGRRPAGGLHADHRRGAPLRRAGGGAGRRRRTRLRRRNASGAGARRAAAAAWLTEVDQALAALVVGRDLRAHGRESGRRRRAGLGQSTRDPAPSRAGRVARAAGHSTSWSSAPVSPARCMAERLAAQLGKRVLLIDRRDHIGGNAYDRIDAARAC